MNNYPIGLSLAALTILLGALALVLMVPANAPIDNGVSICNVGGKVFVLHNG